MMKRIYEIIEEEHVVYTYKRKRFYRCKMCGRSSFKRGLRPSAGFLLCADATNGPFYLWIHSGYNTTPTNACLVPSA